MSKLSKTLSCLVALFLAGCSGWPTQPRARGFSSPHFGPMDSVFTDSELRDACFSNYQGPSGFYRENANPVFTFYMTTWSIHHDNVSRPLQELSTDDPREARTWADSTHAYVYGSSPFDTTGPIVTDRFFEFEPVPTAGKYSHRFRVHRSSYLIRSPEGTPNWDWSYGTFQVRPINEVAMRGLAEYAWFQRSGGDSETKPLTSFSRDKDNEIAHIIYWATAYYMYAEPPKVITLLRTEYDVDIASGVVTGHDKEIRTIPADARTILNTRPYTAALRSPIPATAGTAGRALNMR